MIAIYARVSTEEQAVHGAGLAAQIAACRERVPEGAEVEEFVDAGVSGMTLDRPALQALRRRVADGAVHRIIILDPDRLSRRLAHQLLLTEEWERAGVTLEFVNFEWQDTPEGRLFYSLRGAVAEFEREKIRERTRRGWLAKARQGQLVAGMQRYGYAYDPQTKAVREDPETADVVRRIFRWAAEQRWSTGRIARQLARDGVPAPRGGHWWRDTVSKILRNPAYMGVAYVHRYDAAHHNRERPQDEWIAVPVPAIVDEDTWLRAREVVYHYRKFWKGRQSLPLLLRRLVVCGRCGRPMSTNVRIEKGATYLYYFCPHRYPRRFGGADAPPPCTMPWVRAEPVDQEVWATVTRWLRASPDEWAAIGEAVLADRDDDMASQVEALERDLRRVERARQRLIGMVARDVIGEDEAEPELRRLRSEAAEIEARLAAARRRRPSFADRLQAVLARVDEAIDALPFDERQAVVRELVERVTLDVDDDGPRVTITFRA